MNTITLTEHQKQYINPNAKLWLETLKFGNLPQITTHLQDSGGYCCLGVGCKVYEELTSESLHRRGDGCFSGTTLSIDKYPVVDFRN